jgi:hypothetical protein
MAPKTPPVEALKEIPCKMTSYFWYTGAAAYTYKDCYGPVLFSRVPAASTSKCNVFVVCLM